MDSEIQEEPKKLDRTEIWKLQQADRSKSIHISDPEPEVKVWFLGFAEQYKGDRAIALRELMRLVEGLCNTGHEEIYVRLEALEQNVAQLSKSEQPKEQFKTVRTLGGKVIKKKIMEG